jgi:uncharacterized cupredoxin-like copper-binding protein
MPITTRTLAAIAVGALLLGGCAGDDEGSATTDLAVTGTGDLAFDPDEFEVPAGEEVTLELTAEGVEHDFVIADAAEVAEAGDEGHGDHEEEEDAEHGDEGDLHVAHADAGETSTATFTVTEAGSYEVYCGVPGHREAGMTASLTVADAG